MMQRLKTGKIWCSLFLSLCLLCSLFMTVPVEAAEMQTSGDWKYVILKDGTVELARYTGKETAVVFPSEIDGKSVTSIGDYAFIGKRWTSVDIPSSVTNIGNHAFYQCNSLTSIDIPSSVTNIGDAFYQCNSLTSINVAGDSQNYTSKDGILYNKSCKSLIRCPEGKQGTITIPSSVTDIMYYAFYNCSSLTSINVAGNSQNYASKDGILYDKSCKSLICCPDGKQGTITIPSSVTDIGKDAFRDCSSLTSIIIPSSVTNIGAFAFWGCKSLTSITIPSSVTSIGNSSFVECSPDLAIYAEVGSYAEGYVKEKGMEFKCLHTSVTDPAIAPTCTKVGKTEGSHCSACNEIIKPQEDIPATGHTYRQNTQKATVKKNGVIQDKCNACGDIKLTTTIYAASGIKLSKTFFTYNGKNQKPAITIKDSKGNKLPADSYKVTCPEVSKKVGKYTVTVTLQGNYSGKVKLTYQITPKATSISRVTAMKKGFTVKWKKQTKQTTGYQLQYSTSKRFKGAKTVTIKKNKTISKSIKKLRTGKKYYVRIRTYKTVKIKGKNVKIYSGWSKVKSVRTKK